MPRFDKFELIRFAGKINRILIGSKIKTANVLISPSGGILVDWIEIEFPDGRNVLLSARPPDNKIVLSIYDEHREALRRMTLSSDFLPSDYYDENGLDHLSNPNRQVRRCCRTCSRGLMGTDGVIRCGEIPGNPVSPDCICDLWRRGDESLPVDTHVRLYVEVVRVCNECPAYRRPCHGGQPYCVRTGTKIPVGEGRGIPDWCPFEKVTLPPEEIWEMICDAASSESADQAQGIDKPATDGEAPAEAVEGGSGDLPAERQSAEPAAGETAGKDVALGGLSAVNTPEIGNEDWDETPAMDVEPVIPDEEIDRVETTRSAYSSSIPGQTRSRRLYDGVLEEIQRGRS